MVNGVMIGNNTPTTFYVGSSLVSAIYHGENAVWPSAAPGVPDDYADLEGWWRSSDITGLADGDPVATWPAHTGTDGTVGIFNQPTYRASGGPSSTPTVEFSGGQYLLCGTGYTSDPITLFVVVYNDTTNYHTMVGPYSSGGMQFRFSNINKLEVLRAQQALLATSSATVATGTWHVLCFKRNSTSMTFGVNETMESTQTINGTAFATPEMYLGASSSGENMDGKMSQIARFGRELPNADCEDIMAWMAANPSG